MKQNCICMKAYDYDSLCKGIIPTADIYYKQISPERLNDKGKSFNMKKRHPFETIRI